MRSAKSLQYQEWTSISDRRYWGSNVLTVVGYGWLVQPSMVWYGMIWFVVEWHSMAQDSMVWLVVQALADTLSISPTIVCFRDTKSLIDTIKSWTLDTGEPQTPSCGHQDTSC